MTLRNPRMASGSDAASHERSGHSGEVATYSPSSSLHVTTTLYRAMSDPPRLCVLRRFVAPLVAIAHASPSSSIRSARYRLPPRRDLPRPVDQRGGPPTPDAAQ